MAIFSPNWDTCVLGTSIEGSVTNASSAPLSKVPICLKTADSKRDCVRLVSSDRSGQYKFNGLKAGNHYVVEVLNGDPGQPSGGDRPIVRNELELLSVLDRIVPGWLRGPLSQQGRLRLQ